jgi:polar amino acid transport system substrate-binding protein
MVKRLLMVFVGLVLLLSGCEDKDNKKEDNSLKIGICSDYPPFEDKESGNLVGFDVDLVRLLAKEMGKEIVFVEMRFRELFPALQNGTLDAVISTVTTSADRRKDFDFSRCYYTSEKLAAVYEKNEPYTNENELSRAKLACQLGTTAERWIKEHVKSAQLIMMDSSVQLIDALKAGHIDCVVIDEKQAEEFCRRNPALSYSVVSRSEEGYAILLKKQSPLKEKFNMALKKLGDSGELEKLKTKWLEDRANGSK